MCIFENFMGTYEVQLEALHGSSPFIAGMVTVTQLDQRHSWEQNSSLPLRPGSLLFPPVHLGTSGDPPWNTRGAMSSASSTSGLRQWGHFSHH